MKRGTAKAVKLGMRMLKWLEENEERDGINSYNCNYIFIENYDRQRFPVRFTGNLVHHKEAAKFKKAFPEIGKLTRSNIGQTMSFKGNSELIGIPLEVTLQGITGLPNNCRVETVKVWQDERTVITKAGYIEESNIVCNNAS